MLKKLKFLKKLFGSTNERKLAEIKPIIDQINKLEKEFENLNDSDLKAKTAYFKKEIRNGKKLDDILPEAFAAVREASKRTIGQRHFDVQLIGGICLHQGKIAEMKTGEGKTLVATLAAYLNALQNKGVHIVTVNDYLAERDSKWMGQIFNFLNLKVGCLANDISDENRKIIYDCDIIYGTNNEFAFDYLRDNMKLSLNDMVQNEFNFCIVDEVDSILIDEARTPLIISGPSDDNSNQYFLCTQIVKSLDPEHYQLDEKDRNVNLTEKGIDQVEKKLKSENKLKGEGFYDPRNLSLVHHINQSLKANLIFIKDKDYIVRDNKVEIIDEFTGRVLEGRRYSDGLHQAIEAKEGVTIQKENQTFASITYQNYFRLYKKLSGMTGTAITEAEEFFDIYKLDVVEIPTNQKMIRKDLNDQIYRSEKEKNNAILEDIIQANKKLQPILVGTTSIDKSEKISKILKSKKIDHSVLNAKHHEKEAKIISKAGEPGSITIATNMAGRGTDIQLGGNLDKKLEGIDPIHKDNILQKHKEDKKKVINSGGLFVIGTERHESRRIDNQLRGRSGRQGDNGKSIFYLSLEDDLMRIFGSEKIEYMLQKLGLKPNEALDHPWINKALEKAQQKVEARNFEIRKTLLQFDDVMNDQRNVIYEQRYKILSDSDIYKIIDEINNEIISDYITQVNIDLTNKSLIPKLNRFLLKKITENDFKYFAGLPNDEKKISLSKKYQSKRKERIKLVGDKVNRDIEKKIFLQNLDFEWRNHLQYLEQLRQVIGLRGYGQRNPIDEYKKESFELFQGLLLRIKENIIVFLTNINLNIEENIQNELSKEDEKIKIINRTEIPKLSRNDKCSCGSGKKYKHCCGALA